MPETDGVEVKGTDRITFTSQYLDEGLCLLTGFTPWRFENHENKVVVDISTGPLRVQHNTQYNGVAKRKPSLHKIHPWMKCDHARKNRV